MKEYETRSNRLPFEPEPYWREGVQLPTFPPMEEDQRVDVAIVGGGITGITAAYLLIKEGVKVALVEADRLLNGTTGHTTAKVTAQHGLIYHEFLQHLGVEKTRGYYEANTESIDFIRTTIREAQIECDWHEEDAYLYATTDLYAKKLEKELTAYRKLSIEGGLSDTIPLGLSVQNALSMKHQGQFHPLKYLSHLVNAFTEAGGQIFENTTAIHVEEGPEATEVLMRNGAKLKCKAVLACSHFPFHGGMGFYFSRMHAVRSYLIAVKPERDFAGGMYLGVDPPKRSVRAATRHGETILLVGGESHKAGQGKDALEHYQALENFARTEIGIKDVLFRWSAQDLTTLDKLPYIGPITQNQPHIMVATGYRKWGMTNGTQAALLLKDLVLNRDNPYKDLFAPTRFYVDPSLKHFFMENTDVAKHLVKGKLEVPTKDPEELAHDEGAVCLVNGQRKGAYKDSDGKLYIVDTTCTHMKCEVNWNHGDRTWDCPCHGSRYSYKGDVIEGPAKKPLKRQDEAMDSRH